VTETLAGWGLGGWTASRQKGAITRPASGWAPSRGGRVIAVPRPSRPWTRRGVPGAVAVMSVEAWMGRPETDRTGCFGVRGETRRHSEDQGGDGHEGGPLTPRC